MLPALSYPTISPFSYSYSLLPLIAKLILAYSLYVFIPILDSFISEIETSIAETYAFTL